jgi:hypothetical protein
MKDKIIIDILEKIKTTKPSLTYARILKFSDILKNINKNMIGNGTKLSLDKSKRNRKILMDSGMDNKELTIKFKNIDYTFNIQHDAYSVFYRLYQSKRDDECIFVIVDKVYKTCEIHTISYNSQCTPRAEITDRNGSGLLKIALKLIYTVKNRYKINRIQLTDNSNKNCKGKQLRLGMMLTLLTGTTWYGKYGFYPKDKRTKIKMENNEKIMNNTLLSDKPELKEMIIRAHKKSKSNLDIQKIIGSYNYALHKKYKLKEFLTKFLLDYDLTCIIFYYFYDEIFTKLKLIDMYGEIFIKDI